MDASNPVAETVPASASSYCQKKRSEDTGFLANMKESVRDFFHTPMEGHKSCLKAQYHKFMAKFEDGKPVPKEGENSAAPIQTSAKIN